MDPRLTACNLEPVCRVSWSLPFWIITNDDSLISTISRENLSTRGYDHKNYKVRVVIDSYVICSTYLKSLEIEMILFCENRKAAVTCIGLWMLLHTLLPINRLLCIEPQVLPSTLLGVVLFTVLFSCGGNMWARTVAEKEWGQELWNTIISDAQIPFWGICFLALVE